MSNNIHSRARVVIDRYGLSLDRKDLYLLDCAFLLFFPNHIDSVLTQVLKGDPEKRKRFVKKGWAGYMHAPVCNILGGRTTAYHDDIPTINLRDLEDDEWRYEVWDVMHRMIIQHDYNHKELLDLIWTIPNYTAERPSLLYESIRIARTSDHYSIPYVRGVVIRQSAQMDRKLAALEAADLKGELEHDGEFVDHTPEELAELERKLEEVQRRIELMRKINGK